MRKVILDYDETVTYKPVMREVVNQLALVNHGEIKAKDIMARFVKKASEGKYEELEEIILEAARGMKRLQVERIFMEKATEIEKKWHRPNVRETVSLLCERREVYVATSNFKQVVIASMGLPAEKVIGCEFEYDEKDQVNGFFSVMGKKKAAKIEKLVGENEATDFVIDGKWDMDAAKVIEARGGRVFAFYPVKAGVVKLLITGYEFRAEIPIKPRKATFSVFTDDFLVVLGLLKKEELASLPGDIPQKTRELFNEVYTRERGELGKLAGVQMTHISAISIGEYHDRVNQGRERAKIGAK